MKISILLPAYKSEKLFEKVFLPSFGMNASKIAELIVYDNGGNGNLKEVVETHKALCQFYSNDFRMNWDAHKITVIGNGINIGLNRALNECAKVAKGEYFFLPHTDMHMMSNCLDTLVLAAKNQPPASFLMCSRSIEPTVGHTRHHIIKNYGQEAEDFKLHELLKDFKNYKDNTIEVGARMPFFMHRKLWDNMRGVDENYFSYCTDDDLIQTAWDVGVRKFWMVHDSLVYHLQGKSNNQQKVDKDSNKPYEYFISKWKDRGYPNAKHPAYMHPEMIPFYAKVK